MRASPQGEVLMYRWNWTFSFSLKPCLSSHLVKMEFCCSSSWLLETQMWNQVTLYHMEFYGKFLISWQGAFKLYIKTKTHTVLVKVWHAGEKTCVAQWSLFYWIQDIWILQVFKLTCQVVDKFFLNVLLSWFVNAILVNSLYSSSVEEVQKKCNAMNMYIKLKDTQKTT